MGSESRSQSRTISSKSRYRVPSDYGTGTQTGRATHTAEVGKKRPIRPQESSTHAIQELPRQKKRNSEPVPANPPIAASEDDVISTKNTIDVLDDRHVGENRIDSPEQDDLPQDWWLGNGDTSNFVVDDKQALSPPRSHAQPVPPNKPKPQVHFASQSTERELLEQPVTRCQDQATYPYQTEGSAYGTYEQIQFLGELHACKVAKGT